MQDPAARASTRTTGRSFVLRFISGKYQGGEFPIAPEKDIVVGRSSDLDMVLVEDMVSRRHARIAIADEQIWIEDLGSTNGTFVNGEKIKRARLKEGDRVLIGTSILKVIASEAAQSGEPVSQSQPPQPRANLENIAVANERRTQARSMSGSIEEVPLPDLMQLFGTSKKNGVLVIRTDDDTGRIYMRKGNVYYATINDSADVTPVKSLYRMLGWMKGEFDLEPADETEFPNQVDLSVQEILMEGMRQMDEFGEIRHKLPDMESRVHIPQPLGKKLRELKPEELDVFQLALDAPPLRVVFDRSEKPDLETGQALVSLFKQGYFETES